MAADYVDLQIVATCMIFPKIIFYYILSLLFYVQPKHFDSPEKPEADPGEVGSKHFHKGEGADFEQFVLRKTRSYRDIVQSENYKT